YSTTHRNDYTTHTADGSNFTHSPRNDLNNYHNNCQFNNIKNYDTSSIQTQSLRDNEDEVFRLYIDAYRKGLNAKQAEYAIKKYKRHRVISQSIFEELS
ncbi:16455_t:CDS:2, partial [Funneliformis caledonium]